MAEVLQQEPKKDEDRTLVILNDGTEALAPSHEVFQGIKQNKWKLPEQDVEGNPMTMMVRDNQGSFEMNNALINQNINTVFQDKLQVETMGNIKADEEQRRKEIVSEAFDMPTTAFLTGAASGATFGLSEVALNKMLGEQAVKRLKEENPNATFAGDVAGTVLPAILSGGTGLAAKVATKTGAGAASKFATKMGDKAAQKIIAKYGVKNEAAQKAIQLGAQSTIEGALFSGGRSLVDETLLGDEQANYAKVLEDTLTGALFEGALGTALGPTAHLLGKGLKKGAAKGVEFAKHPKLWDGVKKVYGKAVRVAKGKQAGDAVEDLFNKDKYDQEQVATYLDDISQADTDLGVRVNEFMGEVGRVTDESKRLRMEALSDPELDEFWTSNEKFLDEYNRIEKTFNETLKEVGTNPNLYDPSLARNISKYKSVLDPAAMTTMRDFAERTRAAKAQINDLLSRYFRKSKGIGLDDVEQSSLNLLLPLKNEIDKTIKNYDLFGPIGDKLKLSDMLYSSVIEPKRAIEKLGGVDGYKALEREGEFRGVAAEKQFDPTIVGQILRKKTGAKRKAGLDNAFSTLLKSFDQINKNTKNLNLAVDFDTKIQSIKDHIDLTKRINAIERATGRNLESMLFGQYVGGVPGMVAGAAVANPVAMTKLLIGMEKRINKYQRSMDDIGDVFSKKMPKIPRALNVIHPIMYDLTDTKKKEEPKKVIEKFQNGDAFQLLDNRIRGIESIAPKHAEVMRQQTATAQQLISKELPPVVQSGVLGRESKLVMTPAQTQRINQVMLAVYAPKTFLDYIKSGTATKAGMNALKVSHPTLFSELQMKAGQAIIQKEIPYQNKLKLQYMFDLPTTFELSDISIKQQAWGTDQGASQEQAQGGQPDPTGSLRAKGLDKMQRSEQNAAPSAQFG